MGSWVKFYLQGTMSNRDAIGSLIQVNFSDGSSQIRQYSGSGYQSQSLAGVHFGAAENLSISSINIKWPNGLEESYNDLNTNSTYKIIEGQALNLIDNNTSIKIQGCTDEIHVIITLKQLSMTILVYILNLKK